jgi:organic radical activating enzyme
MQDKEKNMNMVQINLIQSCNLRCKDCPMAQWIYDIDQCDKNGKRLNSITNAMLIPWLEKYCPPDEWLLDITGGEPGMYAEIGTLIPALSDLCYKGVIRTNGTLPIPASDNFIRIAAWHRGLSEPPEYFDHIIIFKNKPNDDRSGKESFCKTNKIPYVLKTWHEFSNPERAQDSTNDTPKELSEVHSKQYIRLYSNGGIGGCPLGPYQNRNIDKLNSEKDWLSQAIPTVLQGGTCTRCHNIFDAERHMPEEWF